MAWFYVMCVSKKKSIDGINAPVSVSHYYHTYPHKFTFVSDSKQPLFTCEMYIYIIFCKEI
jgi:hypothetical protein